MLQAHSHSHVTIALASRNPRCYAVRTIFRGEHILLGTFSRPYAVKAAAIALTSAKVLETFPSADRVTAKHVKAVVRSIVRESQSQEVVRG
jgi:hypothetical protein